MSDYSLGLMTKKQKVPHKSVWIDRKVPHKSAWIVRKVPHKSVLIFQKVPHKNVICFAFSLIFSIFAQKTIYGKIYHARPHCLEKQKG